MTKYKIGDTINLKTLEKLLLEKQNECEEIIETAGGFHLKSGLLINKSMFKFLGNSFSIKSKTNNYLCSNSIGYELKMDEPWTWDELCFEEGKQLEFNF
jgi:hypothetical protein